MNFSNFLSRKFLLIFLTAVIFCLIPFSEVGAVCPVCVVAIGAGVGLSRWLGIDDTISGVWLGGLIVSFIIWFLSWLDKKQIKFRLRWLVVSVLFYAIILLPLYWRGIIGHFSNKIFCIDKIIFGTACGSAVFILSVWLYSFLKKRNNDRPYFPFQKIVMPILFLAILSLVFYIISKCV